jgi:uncharacterized protein YndB with AHSA1/START domain
VETSSVIPQPTGEVVTELCLAVPADRAWRAVTDPALVARWFGRLDAPLRPGRPNRLDFEDGDFFTLADVRRDAGDELAYSWRFLGFGPPSVIRWRVEPDGDGSRVTIRDSCPGRPDAVAIDLRQGWLDFTARLERYLTTGESARYDWRREVDGAAMIPAPAADVWAALHDQRVGLAVISAIEADPPGEVRFACRHPAWGAPTACAIRLTPLPGAVMAAFRHTGWERLSGAEAFRQRKRFAGFWVVTWQRLAGHFGAEVSVGLRGEE